MKRSILGCLALFFVISNVNANLLVTPTRAELDDKRQKSAIFSLVNKGSVTSRYNIYFQDKRQLPTGDYQSVDGKGVLAKYVRYSPRRITLDPEQGTRVRVALRLPKGVKPGEYRSYLVFNQIPLTEAESTSSSDDNQSLSLSISAVLRISVPVVLRVGELNSEVEIATGQLNPQTNNVSVTLARAGSRSTYGDIEVLTEVDGKKQTIGSYKNAALYTEISERNFAVSLDSAVEASTKLWVRYSESDQLPNPQVIEYALN
ncbi:molecular chaperone [Shewanella waksmanii]|uniref:fimbrial biogenesis chaperone n=1 Tax=Shewanella waksmanii TaxID=213783 RepID=UPI0037363450